MIRRLLALTCAPLAACGLALPALADEAKPASASAPVLADKLTVMRLYGGADGESHIEKIALPDVGSIPGKMLQSRLYTTDIEIGEAPPGAFVDWHGVSSPRFLIVLQGQIEIGLGDGSKHILKAGDMVLAADTTGRGHTSRMIGNEIVRSLTVRLPKDDPLAPKLNPCPPGVAAAQCVAAKQAAAAARQEQTAKAADAKSSK
jgi:hypothetical protein